MSDLLQLLRTLANMEHLFGTVMAASFVFLLWWVLRSLVRAIEEQTRQIRIHGSLLMTMQLSMLADKPADFEPILHELREIRGLLAPVRRPKS